MMPLTSTLLSVGIISCVGPVGGLQLPGINLLGGVAIVLGLGAILRDGVKEGEAHDASFSTLNEEADNILNTDVERVLSTNVTHSSVVSARGRASVPESLDSAPACHCR
ncbi:MAG: hypothetical protein SGPRY_009517 [Prymnesium sp.]